MTARGEWQRSNARQRIERQSFCLDVRELVRSGAFRPGKRAYLFWPLPALMAGVCIYLEPTGDVAEIIYEFEGRSVTEPVDVAWSVPHFGGRRPWWCCPDCRRRCAVLYQHRHFTCRLCAHGGLVHEMAALGRRDRTHRRFHRAATRAGWAPGAPFPVRPRGVHSSTWGRKVRELEYLARAAETAMAPWLGRMEAELAGLEAADRGAGAR